MDLVLFGMQGSGKGTQAKLIAEQCGLSIFETGAQLRKLAKEDSELGCKIASILASGNLVPNEVVMEMVAAFVDSLEEGQSALFDGLPRSVEQKESFDALLESKGRNIQGLLIELNEDEAMTRLLARKRDDDTPEAIRVRIDTFMEKTQPVIDAYAAEGKMLAIDGVQSIEEVNRDIMEAIKPHFECQ